MAIKKTAKKAKPASVTLVRRSALREGGAPKFLTLKKFKTLAETTRRQRISAARKSAPQATTPEAIDLTHGFDPTEDD